MNTWQDILKYAPLPLLLSSHNRAINYFTSRDLLAERVMPVQTLWATKPAMKIIKKQQANGSWKYPGGNIEIRRRAEYDQLETYRVLGFLIEKHGFNQRHSAIPKAAEFLLKFQTSEGDFRGIYGNQYTPNYTAGIMELLIKAGYADDKRIRNGFEWLLSIRQDDGGWAIPIRTIGMKLDSIALKHYTIQPDRSKPFSHLVTGCVLRAFAVHQEYSKTIDARKAGNLLVSRIFMPDVYPDRNTLVYWTSFRFPFWFNDLLSVLDSLSRIGYKPDDPKIRIGLDWFIRKQEKNGLWKLRILAGGGDPDLDLWMTLQICRVFKRFYK